MNQSRAVKPFSVRKWGGLVSNRGPLGAEPGDAKVQKNLRSQRVGVLQTRGGQRILKWE